MMPRSRKGLQWLRTNGFMRTPGNAKARYLQWRLKQLAVTGNITPSTLVWKEGLPQWTPAKAIRGLFPANAAVAAEPTPVDPPSSSRFDPPARTLLDVIRDVRHPLDIVIDRLRYAIPQDITAQIL